METGPDSFHRQGIHMATKGEQSRQRILEASRSIILESGIGKLSHGAIAEVLDISNLQVVKRSLKAQKRSRHFS